MKQQETTPARGGIAAQLAPNADNWLLWVLGAVALLFALAHPLPLSAYPVLVEWRTVGALCGLLILTKGIELSGILQRTASRLLAQVRDMRRLALLLVTFSAGLSALVTNDVSLFLLVPLTLAIGRLSNLPVMRAVVLEALAVNAGSTLSPIGNPQNLLLWQYGQLPFLAFTRAMLPAFATMFVLVVALTLLWMPRGRVQLHAEDVGGHPVSIAQAVLSVGALASMVLMMEHGHAVLGAVLLLVPFALLERTTLIHVDWLLLATFAAIFLGLGHFAELGPVQHALDGLNLDNPLTLYVSGIVASQLISNVPATVLLLRHAPDAAALAVAVNVGGFGLAIGSLANLIALRLAKQPRGARLLHLVSVPFLLVCAPLVYVVWRWLG